jgi:flagellar biosynthesis/type III secretory pathway protein FliH
VAPWHPPDLRTVAGTGRRGDAVPVGPTLEEAAYQRGFEAGQAAAAAAQAVMVEEARAALAAAITGLERTGQGLQARFTESVNALAVGIAWHLAEREFAADPAQLQQLVARALVLAPLAGPVTLRLHPEDLAALQRLPGVLDTVPATVELRWTADPAVGRGGCLLEGPASVVDGRLDRALLDIYERLSSD